MRGLCQASFLLTPWKRSLDSWPYWLKPEPLCVSMPWDVPLLTLAPVCPSTPQTLCEQLRQENEALKAKLDKSLEQRDQAAERLR